MSFVRQVEMVIESEYFMQNLIMFALLLILQMQYLTLMG